MDILSGEQWQAIQQYIYRNGRLLERQLFECFFGKGSPEACLQALRAYQNPDGGFGNGIEPDLLCPDSSGIGAETAMFVLDVLDVRPPEIVDPLIEWIVSHQSEAGTIPHPPPRMADYPHQPWWKNADDDRVLTLAGYLKKWGIARVPPSLLVRVRGYYETLDVPGADAYYGYPYFVYLKYCAQTDEDRVKWETMTGQIPAILEQHADHFPLFSRAWYHAVESLPREVVEAEAQKFLAAIQEDGGLDAPYPNLPWWRPIWTVDGLVLLKRASMV